MKKLIVFGSGQMAEIAHVYLGQVPDFEIVAFTVDRQFNQAGSFRGIRVVDFEDVQTLLPPDEYYMFVPIGAKELNQLRTRTYHRAKAMGYRFISYVSPLAQISPEVEIGENCFIFESNVIQPFVRIGNNVILWSGNHIGHHTTIGDNCFVASHVVISGCVTVEPFCYFGVNSTVRDAITIARSCIIGAGALILKSTECNQVFRGQWTKAHSVSSDQVHVA